MKRQLSNPFFIGIFRYNWELYEGSHEPLISKKLFEEVQEIMKRKGKPNKQREHIFPFVGLMKCGECGCSITAERQKGHHYYRCSKKRGPCSQKYIREEALVSQIQSAIQRVSLRNDWAKKMLEKIEEWKKEEILSS